MQGHPRLCSQIGAGLCYIKSGQRWPESSRNGERELAPEQGGGAGGAYLAAQWYLRMSRMEIYKI